MCFDLSKDTPERYDQIAYWLNYLHSLLSPPPSTSKEVMELFKKKWKVVLVGVKADLEPSSLKSNGSTFSSSLTIWQHTWNSLPLHNQVFLTSKNNSLSIKRLWKAVQIECNGILEQFTKQIPRSYLALLNHLQLTTKSMERPFLCIKDVLGLPDHLLMPALRYLHSVGDIVLMQDEVCTDPSYVARLLAKFICPESIRQSLLISSGKVDVLTQDQVGTMLSMTKDDPQLLRDFQMLNNLGICYQLPTAHVGKPIYLFPSLAGESTST